MEIKQLNLHIAQMVGGQMVGTVNAAKLAVVMEETPVGVYITGPKTQKLIPYSNIQGIDYVIDEK